MTHIPLITLFAVMLSACASLPYDSASFLRKAATDASLDTRNVKYHTRCEYGVTALNAGSAVFQQCAYVQTDREVILLGWNKETGAYRKDLVIPLSRIDRAALNSFGLSRQLQLFSEVSQLVINLYPGGPSRQIEDSEMVFALMTKAGVRAIESRGWVRPSNDGVIPIFLPRK